MKDFQQRKKVRRMITSRIVFVVLFVVTALLVRGSYGVFLKERETNRDLVKAKESLALAEARRQELTASIGILKTPQGLEKEIRDRFSVAKSGEEIVLVVDSKKEEKPVQESSSVLQRMGEWVKNIF
jgi:cell division protein FtsB